MSTVKEDARGIERAHTVLNEARERERKSAIERLEAFVEDIKPALPFLVERIVTSELVHSEGGVTTTRTTLGPELLYVSTGGSARRRANRDDPHGSYVGLNLCIDADGTWVEVRYTGEWVRGEGKSKRWQAEHRTLPLPQVAREYDVEWIVDQLSRTLTQAASPRWKPTCSTCFHHRRGRDGQSYCDYGSDEWAESSRTNEACAAWE